MMKEVVEKYFERKNVKDLINYLLLYKYFLNE